MRHLWMCATVVLLCAMPASAGIVDGHVYADFYQKGYGTVELGGGAQTIEEALEAVDGKYVKISAEYYSETAYWFSLIVKFPAPALNYYFRVHFVNGTTSSYFSVQQHAAYVGDLRYRDDLATWSVPPYPIAPEFGMWWPSVYYPGGINFIEIHQRQQYSPGAVFIDAIEALNIPPVVDAGPDMTINVDEVAATTIQGTITDSYGCEAGYVWQKDGVSLTGWNPFPADGSAPLNLATLGPLAEGSYTFKLVTKDGGVNFTDEMVLTVSSNAAPTADAGGPYNVGASTFFGANVQLDAGGSSDPDAGDTLSYLWTVGGETYSVVSPTVFFAIGQTDVSLTVTDSKGASSTVATTVTVSCELADIDVKPDSEDNVINMGSNGVIPVAFLSSPEFDATTIKPETVALRGEDYVVSGVVRMRGKKDAVPQASMTDVNGDGLVDLLVHVETDKLADQDITAQISLGAMTSAGQVVIGYDNVTVIHDE